MKLTILETGLVPAAIRDRFEDYPSMFQHLMGPLDNAMQFEAVSVISGAVLPDPEGLDAVLITGSPASVYDDDPWVSELRDYIRVLAGARVPMIGICYGHQAMADALGGDVGKSDKGWGIGRHSYTVSSCPPGISSEACPSVLNAYVSHQDQVLVPPDGAEVVAGSEFTPNAALSYRDIPALSFQCHPEFSADYSQALYEARRGRPLTEAAVEDAVASLALGNNHRVIGVWMVQFLHTHATK